MKEEKIKPGEFCDASGMFLIPFKYRVQASIRGEAGYKDSVGEQFFKRIDFNWDLFNHKPAYWWVVVRTEILDKVVWGFIRNNPNAVIINLGAGLCTRYYRMANPSVKWVEIDLPEVFKFRRQLNDPHSDNHVFIESSVTDFKWMDQLGAIMARPKLFVAEGILMYLTVDENRKLFREIGRRFSGSDIIFEAISRPLVLFKNFFIRDKFKWGMEDKKELENWAENMLVTNQWFYNHRHDELLPFTRRIVHRVPIFQKMMRIVKVKFIRSQPQGEAYEQSLNSGHRL